MSEPTRCQSFAAELARLLILRGFDVDARIYPREVHVTARIMTPDRRHAGVGQRWDRETIEYSTLAPMSLAIMAADRMTVGMPEPS